MYCIVWDPEGARGVRAEQDAARVRAQVRISKAAGAGYAAKIGMAYIVGLVSFGFTNADRRDEGDELPVRSANKGPGEGGEVKIVTAQTDPAGLHRLQGNQIIIRRSA